MFTMIIQLGKAYSLFQVRYLRSSSNPVLIKGRLLQSQKDIIRKSLSNPASFHKQRMTTSISEVRDRLVSEEDDSKQSQSVYSILQSSTRLLEESNISEPDLSACHLLSYTLKGDFQWEDNGPSVLYRLLSGDDSSSDWKGIKNKLLTDEEYMTFTKMIQRRLTNEPLQYIIGQWDFHDITIKIRQPCLCPRPETEELVELVAKDIKNLITYRKTILDVESKINGKNKSFKKVRILDVGCGTGAISIALANMFSPEEVEFVSIDVAREAVKLTQENADMVLGKVNENDTHDSYYKSILCSAGKFTNNAQGNKSSTYDFGFDIVVSNPPYIPKQDMDTLAQDVVGYEDFGALCGGDDGMDVIRDIVQRLPEWCQQDDDTAQDSICWMEVDTSHPKLMESWLSPSNNSSEGVQYVEGLNDFFGLPRFVKLRIKNNTKI